jgi:hypothetical protein
MDSAFGHWLAGFIDGEGSFGVVRLPHGPYQCRFHLVLRDDDLPILEEIKHETGLGWIFRGRRSASPNGKPQAVWIIQGRREASALAVLLADYPLRAKKARDLSIWTEAVREWNRVGGVRSGHHGPADWSGMKMLKERLEQGRRYQASDTAAPVVAERLPQLALGEPSFAEAPERGVDAADLIRLAREKQERQATG